MNTSKDLYIQGEKIPIFVSCKYYFQAPVKEAKINYSVYTKYYHRFYEEYDEEEEDYGGYCGFITSGEAKTDKEGNLHFAIDAKNDEDEYDKTYIIEVSVIDETGKGVKASKRVIVTRGEFDIDITSDKYIYNIGDIAKIVFFTFNHKGKPIITPLKIRIFKEGYKNGQYVYNEVFGTSSWTNKGGKYEFMTKIKEPGYLKILAEATDKRGNNIKKEYYIHASSNDYCWSYPSYKELEILADKKSYSEGEIAKIMINTSNPDIYCLFSIEREKVFECKTIFIKGYSKIIEVPITSDYLPNVYISVAYAFDKTFYNETILLDAPRIDKQLQIKVLPNKKSYMPSEEAVYEIKTYNHDGKPISSELSIGIVDEAIYVVCPDKTKDIFRYFYPKRENLVRTDHSFPREYYAGEGKDREEPYIRKKFPDTLLWLPNIVTDEKGKATITFRFQDSLTEFRATIRAHTKDSLFGNTTKNVVVTKKLIAMLGLPRFFTQDDKITISGIVHNYTDREENVDVEIRGKAVKLLSETKSKIKIPANKTEKIDYDLEIIGGDVATITFFAKGKEEADAIEIVIPILPNGLERIKASAARITESLKDKFDIPQKIISDTVNLRLSLTPSIAGSIIDVLKSLRGYPYGCVEQTLSKFLPDVVLMKALRELNLEDKALSEEAQKMIEEGLVRLYNFQHSDGGWGWWHNDATNLYMTSYVIQGLLLTKEGGIGILEERLERGLDYLKRSITSVNEINERCYILYTLSLGNRFDKGEIEKIYEKRGSIKDYSLSLLSIILYKMNDGRWEKLLNELEKKAIDGSLYCCWEDTAEYGWMDNNIETTALALKSFLLMKPNSDKVPKIVKWLMENRKKDGWTSTKESAIILCSLCDYLRISGELKPDYKAYIFLNNALIKELEITEKDVLKQYVIEMREFLKGENIVVVKKEGTGSLHYSRELRYFNKEKLVKEDSQKIKISRDYYRGEKPILGMGKQGNEILVKLNITPDVKCEYVIIEDFLPSGAEVVYYNPWNWPFSYAEVRDNRIVFFANYLSSKNTYSIMYKIRLERKGNLHIMPTRAYMMYAPTINGNGNEYRIEVK